MIGWQAAYIIARKIGESQQWPAAIAIYKLIDRTSRSTDSRVYYQLGNAYYNNGQDERALECLRLATASQPENIQWLYRIGFILERAKKYRDAIDVYDQILLIDDRFAAAYKRKSTSLLKLNQREGSLSTLQAGFDRCPTNIELADILAKRLERDGPRWQEVDVLQKIYPSVRGSSGWNYRIAKAYSSMNRHDDASHYYNRANHLQPGNSNHLFEEGRSWKSAGRETHADKAFQSAIASDTKRNSAIFGLGVFYQQIGDWENAAVAYSERCLLVPDNAELRYKYGLALERSYDWESALREYQKAVQLDSSKYHWFSRLGLVHERMNQWTEASHNYRIAAENAESNAVEYFYRLGYTLNKSNKTKEACQAFVRMRDDEGESSACETISPSRKVLGNRINSLINEFNGSSKHNPELCYAIGNGLYVAGEYAEAIFYFMQMNVFPDAHGITMKSYRGDKTLFEQMQYTSWTETLPVDQNVVFYETFHSDSIGCNPLAIYRELRRDPKYSHLRHVWSVGPNTFIPAEIITNSDTVLIQRNSEAYRRYLATAKYLISNVTFGSWFVRRAGQQYLNTWHGTPLKTLGRDIKSGYLEHKNVARNFLQATHVLSGNPHTTEVLTQNYDISPIWTAKLAETGYPRVDRTLNMNVAERRNIRAKLGISPSKEDRLTILYAPTWRGGLNTRHFDTQKLTDDIARLQALDANIIFQAHHYTELLLRELSMDVTMVPEEVESNDLLGAIDILITDYSSIAVDFLATQAPVFFYTYDYDEYMEQRGLYFDQNELPGTVCSTIDELIAGLMGVINHEISIDMKLFSDRFCPMDDGYATDRAIRFFFESDDTHVVDISLNSKKSILLHHSFIPNGITSSAQNLIGSLDPNDFNCTIVVPAEQTAADTLRIAKLQELPDNIAIIGRTGRQLFTPEEKWIVDRLNKNRNLSGEEQWEVYRKSYEREFRRIFGVAHFDAVIEFEGYSILWASILGCTDTGSEKSIYLHNDMNSEWANRFPYLESLFNLYRFFDNLISVSPAIRKENCIQLEAQFKLGESRFIDCVNQINPAGVLDRANEDLDSDFTAFIRPGAVCLVSIGRLSPEKDHSKLIDAFDKVRGEMGDLVDLQLIILGDGPLMAVLSNKIKQLSLEEQVMLGGLRSNPFPVLRRSDAFVLSSNHEGQPMVLLEALVLGRRIISTDIIGTRYVLGDDHGLLVHNSVDGLARGIRDLALGQLDSPQFDASAYVKLASGQFVDSVFRHSFAAGMSVRE